MNYNAKKNYRLCSPCIYLQLRWQTGKKLNIFKIKHVENKEKELWIFSLNKETHRSGSMSAVK